MTDIMKTKLRAVAFLLYIFIATVATAGAISTLEGIYIVAGILNIIAAAYIVYKKILKS